MSFLSALATCWDVCKYNCSNSFHDRSWRVYWDHLPELNFDLYDTYAKGSTRAGLVKLEEQLVSSFFCWIFAVPETLVWLGVTIAAVLQTVFFLLSIIVVVVLGLSLASVVPSLALYGIAFAFVIAKEMLHYGEFALRALLRVFLPSIKALVRIPVGIALAAKAVFSLLTTPSPPMQPPPEIDLIGAQPEQAPNLFDQVRNRSIVESNYLLDEEESTQPYHFEEELMELNQPDRRSSSYVDVMIVGTQGEVRFLVPAHDLNRVLITNIFQQPDEAIGLEDDSDSDDDEVARVQQATFYDTGASVINTANLKTENLRDELLSKLKIEDKLLDRYKCIISQCLISKPVLLNDGKFYEQSFIETYLKNYTRSAFNKLPLSNTKFKIITLNSFDREIDALVLALRADYHLTKILGRSSTASEEILATVTRVSDKATQLHAKLAGYIRDYRDAVSKKEQPKAIIARMAKDSDLMISSRVIATTWSYIQQLVGSEMAGIDSDSFLKLKPEAAIVKLLEHIKVLDERVKVNDEGISSSLDNFMITALQEAMLEQQQVSRWFANAFEQSWGFKLETLTQGSLFNKLDNYLSIEQPKDLHQIAKKIIADEQISASALQYTLTLIREPDNAVGFDEFQSEKIDRVQVVNEFLAEWYLPKHNLFRELFLVTLKEVVLKEQKQPGFKNQPTSTFGSIWNDPPKLLDENADRQPAAAKEFTLI